VKTRPVIQEGWDWDPDWQPNGGRIVYQSKEGSHWEIWSINPDGSGLVALTRPETTLVDQLPSNVAPAFSPDGQHIVYLSNRREDEDAGPWRLWVMDTGGANKRPLPIDVELDYGFSAAQVASWGQ
jgi:Tol biopolymer transport system component